MLGVEALDRDRSGWVILDARTRGLWEKGHIPGAGSFSWEANTRTDGQGIDYRVQTPEAMAKTLGSLGITVDTPVLVYGDADSSWGGEGWVCWVLTYMGHQGTIALLDGGIQAWAGQGHPLAIGRESSGKAPAVYEGRPVSAMMVTARDIHDHAGSWQLVDTRSTLEWIRGRLPGAVHIPWEKFVTGRYRQPLDRAAVIALLERNRITLGRPVVYYCTGGIRSAYAWMVHELAGLPGGMNYEGGTAEYWVVYP